LKGKGEGNCGGGESVRLEKGFKKQGCRNRLAHDIFS